MIKFVVGAFLSYLILAGISEDASMNLVETNWSSLWLYVKWIGTYVAMDLMIFVALCVVFAITSR